MADLPDYSVEIAIDKGGTFTDVYASWPAEGSEPAHRQEMILKLLSKDPSHYEDAPREGIRRVLSKLFGRELSRGDKLPTTKISWIRLSTTVGTNALLERQGARHALVITKGFRDLLQIGNQSRPNIFALDIQKPQVLYSRVVEVDERVTLEGYTSDPKYRQKEDSSSLAQSDQPSNDRVRGLSGEIVKILKRPDEGIIREALIGLQIEGVDTLAVVFLHSYTYPDHERCVAKIANELGFKHVSLSCEISTTIKVVPRGISATCDAYLTPVLKEYIDGFFNGFEDSLREDVQGEHYPESGDPARKTSVEFMTSDGGLTSVKSFSGLHSILSGPAGGVVAAALTSWDEERRIPVIGFDMGGTSTDVSRYDGAYEVVFETTTAGVTIQSPQLDINTVASGGGSRLFWKNSLFAVGPESAGADPGPACYKKGGPLAVTDANLILGRLIPKYFPSIFGEKENESLDVEASKKGFESLYEKINATSRPRKSLDEIAHGFLKVANESICRPIRSITEARGFDTTKHVLTGFGGASGQHVCAIAKNLGIKTILLHHYSSVLSAYGLALADRVFEIREPCAMAFAEPAKAELGQRLENLRTSAMQELKKQGFPEDKINLESYLNLRYDGTDNALMVQQPANDDWSVDRIFGQIYKQEFGFTLDDRAIMVDDVRVKAVGKSHTHTFRSPFQEFEDTEFTAGKAKEEVQVYFEEIGRQSVPLYMLDALDTGQKVNGPALILEETQTIVLPPKCTAFMLARHVLIKL